MTYGHGGFFLHSYIPTNTLLPVTFVDKHNNHLNLMLINC